MRSSEDRRRRARGAFRTVIHDLRPIVMNPPKREPPGARGSECPNLTLLKIPMPNDRVTSLTGSLRRHLYPVLRPIFSPIPRDAIQGMRRNYTEQLPKTMRFKTAYLESPTSRAYRAAEYLGVIDLLCSEELRLFAERTSRTSLVPDPGCQVICYESGDFCGPHNDHHPEESHLRNGYIDVHVMLSEPMVASQLLIYEKRRGLLNAVEEVGQGFGIAVYRLPFWHYTTPLIAQCVARNARRWLLLASFEIRRRRRTPNKRITADSPQASLRLAGYARRYTS